MNLIFKIKCLRTKIKYWYMVRYNKEYIKDLEEEYQAEIYWED